MTKYLIAVVKIFSVIVCMLVIAAFIEYEWRNREGLALCQVSDGDDVTSPDGKLRAHVYVSICGLIGGNDVFTTVFIQKPWTWYPAKILQLEEDPHINLQWRDNRTLIVKVSSFNASTNEDIDGIHIEYEPLSSNDSNKQ